MSFSLSGGPYTYNRFDLYEGKDKEEKKPACEKCKGEECECEKEEKKSSGAKPDFLDMDKDGNKEEPMKKALKDKEEVEEGYKPMPIEKMEKQAGKAHKSEAEALKKGDEEGANKHMKRRGAMKSPSSRQSELINKGKGMANEKTRKSKSMKEAYAQMYSEGSCAKGYQEGGEVKALKHRDAKTGEVTDKAEVGKTYYTDGPRAKTSVAKRKEAEMKKEDLELFSAEEMTALCEALGISEESALEMVKKKIEKQYGKGAIHDPSKKKEKKAHKDHTPKDTRTDDEKMTDATGPRPGSRYRGD